MSDDSCAGTNPLPEAGCAGTNSDSSAPISEKVQAERWEAVGRQAVWMQFATARGELTEALHRVQEAIEDDRAVDETAAREARAQLNETRRFLEDFVVPIADGDVDPWDEPPGGGHVPHGTWVDALEDSGRYEIHRRSPANDD